MQPCDRCGRPATLLFLSTACDWCDGTGEFDLWSGYVVWQGLRTRRGSYVFKTRDDAEEWRAANGLADLPIVQVYCEEPFRWRESAGSLKDLVFADKLFEIFPDRFFQRGGNRAFVAEGQVTTAP